MNTVSTIESVTTTTLNDATRLVSLVFFEQGVRHTASLSWHPRQVESGSVRATVPVFTQANVAIAEHTNNDEWADEPSIKGFGLMVECSDDLANAQWRIENQLVREIAHRLNPDTPELVNMASKFSMLSELETLDGGQLKPLRYAIDSALRRAGLSYEALTLASLGSRIHLPGQYGVECLRNAA